MFDVIIIGAGPAGTAAAFDLLAAGLKVLVLDKYEFPRKKACAGGITQKTCDLYRYDISSMIQRKCRTIKINTADQKAFFIRHQKPLCFMTQRDELDYFSLNKIIEKGAQFKIIKKIRSVSETSSCVKINTGQEWFKAAFLIGADGANSIVRRFVSKNRFYKNIFAIEADIKNDNPDRVKMLFDFSKLSRGYFWIFPRKNHVNIGMYSIDPRIKPRRQQLFDYADSMFLSKNLENIKGYPICTGGFNFKPRSNRIFLAGDAAGFAEPLFGEGIYFAVKSGQMAALAIMESGRHTLSAQNLYWKKLKQLRTELKIYDLSARWFYNFPAISLKIASLPFIHRRFAKGYAEGKSILNTLFGQ